jgi:hypothetical protein
VPITRERVTGVGSRHVMSIDMNMYIGGIQIHIRAGPDNDSSSLKIVTLAMDHSEAWELTCRIPFPSNLHAESAKPLLHDFFSPTLLASP